MGGVDVSTVGISTIYHAVQHFADFITSHTAISVEVAALDSTPMVDVSVDFLDAIEEVTNSVCPVLKVRFGVL